MEEQMPQSQPKKGNPSLWIVLILVVLIAAAAILYFGDFFNTNTNSNTNTVANTNTSANANTNALANTNVISNQNTNTATIDTTDWKNYENTKYDYSLKVPDTWGRISELDGSLDMYINKESIQTASSLSLGPSDDLAKELYIQVNQNKTLEQFLADDTITTGTGTKKIILASSDFTTSTGIMGKRVQLDSSSVGSDYAYVFLNGSNLIDMRFLEANVVTALAIINTLQFTK